MKFPDGEKSRLNRARWLSLNSFVRDGIVVGTGFTEQASLGVWETPTFRSSFSHTKQPRTHQVVSVSLI